MKIGFSSLSCPRWDLDTIITQAAEMGFNGVELRGVAGEFHLLAVPALAGDVDGTRKRFAEHNVELVCLSPSASLDARKPARLAEQAALVESHIELASRLGCPFVKIFAGEVGRFDRHDSALGRVVRALRKLVPVAVRAHVTLLVENSGDFTSSDDLWFIIDAVDHPRVQACWNQCNALTRLEGPSVSIPRLGVKIGLAHVCDARVDESGVLTQYCPLGEGDVGVERQIELLRGLVYDGYLMYEWPKAWLPTLPEPDACLPGVAAFLKRCLEAKQAILSAYKGDKKPARLADHRPAATVRTQ